MIKILERYIAKTIILTTCLSALILSSILFLVLMSGELKNIGEGDYGLSKAVVFVLMRMPTELYQFTPLLILLGGIIGLSMLTSHRELTVMRASGFSVKQIIISVLTAALVLTLSIGIVGEWFGPHMSYVAAVNKQNDKNAGQAVVTSSGIWLHVDNNFVHVERVVGHQVFEGVTRYQFDDKHQLQEVYYAKRLFYQNNSWIMSDLVKTTFYNDRAKSQFMPQAKWDVNFNASMFNPDALNPNEMSLNKLSRYTRYLESNGLQASQYKYEFWQRIFQPLASLVMIFLAIPFVLGNLGRTTLGWRVVVGILIGFIFFISNALLGQLSVVFQIPPILAAFLPLLLFAMIGVVMTKQLVKR